MTSHPVPATQRHVTLAKSHLDSPWLSFLFYRMAPVTCTWLPPLEGCDEASPSPSPSFGLTAANGSARTEFGLPPVLFYAYRDLNVFCFWSWPAFENKELLIYI